MTECLCFQTIPIEATMDHVFGTMDDNIDQYKDTKEFAQLVAIDDFTNLVHPDGKPIQPAKPVDGMVFETENPIADQQEGSAA